jgi:lipid-A-disaccharide synthase-like uncharacterized protein
VVSEHRKQSTIPVAFWYLSLAGGLALLTYALLRRDPVFVKNEKRGRFADSAIFERRSTRR